MMTSTDFAARYPEHTKMDEIPTSDRDAIGGFIEWLDSHGFHICKWQEAGDNNTPRHLRMTLEEAEQFGREHPYHTQYQKWDNDGHQYFRVENPEFESWESRFVSVHMDPEKWLASFFEVDLKKLSQEKQQMYEEMRKTFKEQEG
jgi:hypothetical protein